MVCRWLEVVWLVLLLSLVTLTSTLYGRYCKFWFVNVQTFEGVRSEERKMLISLDFCKEVWRCSGSEHVAELQIRVACPRGPIFRASSVAQVSVFDFATFAVLFQLALSSSLPEYSQSADSETRS